jgi:HSP20 family molecular chaperone IbpA
MAARDPNDWMWERAAELLERTAWMQRRFFQAPGERGAAWEPPVDVFEATAEWLVIVALPGVDAQQIEVRLEGGELQVTARRRLHSLCDRAEVRRIEIPQGQFRRRIPMPEDATEIVERKLEDGLLILRLRKRA